jgi:hypothetical protein
MYNIMECDKCRKTFEYGMPVVVIKIGGFGRLTPADKILERWYHYECYNMMITGLIE